MTGNEEQRTRGESAAYRSIGPYTLFGEIASGGMASVHFGRYSGDEGFARTVAIKRLHRQFAADPDFLAMLLDEARLASRIHHPNVVATLDVVSAAGEVLLVMDYVPGESLSRLLQAVRKREALVPPGHAAAIVGGMLHGLHAAHEARDERREPLNIVHRDVSPQNVLVGSDGVPRVLDFGIAKASMRAVLTREGQMKGKIGYMSPEQIDGKQVDRRTDVFAAGIVLWETLTGQRLFHGADPASVIAKVLGMEIPDPRTVVADLPEALAAVTMRALERDLEKRYATALDFALDLEQAIPLPSAFATGRWVLELAQDQIEARARAVETIEHPSTRPDPVAEPRTAPPPSGPATAAHGAARRAQEESAGATEDPQIAAPDAPYPRSDTSAQFGSTTGHSSPDLLPSPPRTSGRLALVVVLSAAAAATGYLIGWRRTLDSGTHPTASVAPSVALRPAPSEAEPRPAVTAPPVASSASASLDAGTAQAAPSPSAAASASVRASEPRAPVRKPTKVRCDPPFVVLPDGIKRVKPECL